MPILAMDPLTLGHTAITFIAIATGLMVLGQMLAGQYHKTLTGVFLFFTVLTSATGYLFHQSGAQPTPAQLVGAISLLDLAVALYALYGKHLAGAWRTIYVISALFSLYLNAFVLVVQLYIKLPSPPVTGGPLFGATQGAVLLAFVAAIWLAQKRFKPLLPP
jgi:hypothetical protein